MAHTIASGLSAQETLLNKYKPVGAKAAEQKKPLHRCFWQAIGRYAHGKSRLVQTCPYAFIINVDESPTTHEHPQAEIWPLMDDQGRTVRPDGEPFTPTFEDVLHAVDHVVSNVRAGVPDAPKCIVIDSLPSLINLSMKYVTWRMISDANERRGGGAAMSLEDVSPFDFRTLHGQTAWALTYDLVVDMMQRISHTNLGVGVIVHCDWKPTQIGTSSKGEAQMEDRPSLSVTHAMRDRYFRNLDFSFFVEKREELETQTVEGKLKTVKTADGKERKIRTESKTVSSTVPKTHIVTARSDISQFLKVRTGLPDSFEVSTWADLEAVYNG